LVARQVHVVFCCDRRVLPGLHVAAFSCVRSVADRGRRPHVHVFSQDLTAIDIALLDQSLTGCGRTYRLEHHRISPPDLSGFPSMRGSWGAYLRLFVPASLSVERFVYLDVDIVCLADVTELVDRDLHGAPAAFMCETTMGATPDASVLRFLPGHEGSPYLNSGVMVVDREAWVRQRVTERCMELLRSGPVDRHEQTALNVVLLGNWCQLEERFNFQSNRRANWPALRDPGMRLGKIIHFLDHPKPWDVVAELVHPHFGLWNDVLLQTQMKRFRSWEPWEGRRFPKGGLALRRYANSVKERMLFWGYSRGLLRSVKGVPRDG
jgi:lipopolysaccharide biosynthesis glycosyltransferase